MGRITEALEAAKKAAHRPFLILNSADQEIPIPSLACKYVGGCLVRMGNLGRRSIIY